MELKCGMLLDGRYRIRKMEFRFRSGILYLAEDILASRMVEIFQYAPFYCEKEGMKNGYERLIRTGTEIFREGAQLLAAIGNGEKVCPVHALSFGAGKNISSKEQIVS